MSDKKIELILYLLDNLDELSDLSQFDIETLELLTKKIKEKKGE